MPSLTKQAALARNACDDALSLITKLRALDEIPRRYVAEMIVVRLFALFEAFVEDSACRLLCGATYCDGTHPALQLSRPTRGFERARDAMRTYARLKPHNMLRWGKAGEIRKNLEYVFPAHEHFVNTLIGHGQFISDLRKVRNHIAHSNAGTRRDFSQVSANYYGAPVNGITPGRMLLSNRFAPILVEQFSLKTRIILRAAVKA